MSKYNLTDILNEFIGGGRIGTLKISYRDLVDKMDELEKSGKVIVRELPGPSGDGKTNREFEVVDRDSAVAGGNKQERGFTVYDYKFGFDPGSIDNYEEEYDFSVGGNNLDLAMELIDDVKPYRMEEDKKELPDSIKKAEQDQIEKDARKARGDIKEGKKGVVVDPDEIMFHINQYQKGNIDGDDLAQAIEEILVAMMSENGDVEDYANEIKEDLFSKDGGSEDNVDNIDKVASPGAKAKDYSGEMSSERDESDEEEKEIANPRPMYEDKMIDAAAKMIKDRILKDIPMDIIMDFVKTHMEDIKGMSNSEIKDEFEEFFSVNYESGSDFMDEDLKKQFKRFM